MDATTPFKNPLFLAALHEKELRTLAEKTAIEHKQVTRLLCGRFVRVGRAAFRITDIGQTPSGAIMLQGVRAFSRRRRPSTIGPLSVVEIVTEKEAKAIESGKWSA